MNEPLCIGQPISWLTLERFRLGEVTSEENRLVTEHCAVCPVCRSCLELASKEPLPLRPLRQGTNKVVRGALFDLRAYLTWPRLATAGALAAAVVAVTIVGLWKSPNLPRGAVPSVKGSATALTLIRERGGEITVHPTTFHPGDRFKVELTCTPPQRAFWDLLVVTTTEVSFPFERGAAIECGNSIVLPGAFSIDGVGPAAICVALGEHLPARSELETWRLERLPTDALCVKLAAQ